MKSKIPELEAHYKLWLSLKNGEGILGDGKWHLLRAIEEYGSISKAAINLGISYRKAWGDLKKIEELLGISVIEKHRGGQLGGSSMITKQGLELIKAYTRFHNEFEIFFQKSFIKFHNEISSL
ncbi:MAG TPA: LysR family transcriptional regulator [Bacteroidales bacterium]|nr:LysR family transcriptional regulator [Bacteroidales bacterium]HPS17320.1 LysR family transcriptional regulator [Bacteroidales bacterium]